MKKADLGLIGALLLVSIVLLTVPRTRAEKPDVVQVYENGIAIYACPLTEDGSYIWKRGEDFVRVEFSERSAYITESSCADQYCVHRGAISALGDAVICLPNRISVVLEGTGEPSLDAVLY